MHRPYLGFCSQTFLIDWKITKVYFTRKRKLLETKLCCRNLVKEINAWAVTFEGYSRSLLKWTREDLKQIDPRTRKLITMDEALYLRDDIDTLYVSRKEEGKDASIEDCRDASIWRLEDNIKKNKERLITATRNSTDNKKTKIKKIKKARIITKKK